MSSTTNIALNSRSMNGIITISDGQAVLENGDLQCDDINSSSLTTGNITSNIFTCNGELRTNLVGPYVIPTIISSLMGSLISYGNTLNSGATDFTNFQSTYTSTKGGFNFWNKSSTQTLTNLAIIDNSQTYFKNQLIGCTAETPVNPTSVANKTYVDSNFVRLINDQTVNGVKTFSSLPLCSVIPSDSTQLINKQYTDSKFQTIADMVNYVNLTTNQTIGGDKTFTGTVFMRDDIRLRDVIAPYINEQQIFQEGTTFTFFPLFNSNIYRFVTKSSIGTQKDAFEITNNTITSNCDFITNNQTTFNNIAPISNTAPSLAAHLTTKTYTDTKFQTIANMTNYVDIATNNQIITGSKIFNNDQLFKANVKIYDQTVSSTKYMQASQLIDTFLLQSQNGQASQFNISLQNVGGAYNTILSMNSSQATIAGSLSVNSILTSNSSATLKNSNTFGTLTSDVQTVNSWLDLKFRTRIYDVFGSANFTQLYMIGGLDFVIGANPNNGTIQLYSKTSVGADVNMFSFTPTLNTSRVPLTCLQQATFNTVAPLCSIAPSSGDSLCNKTYVDSVGASSILALNNTFTGTNTFSNDVTLSKTKNTSTYATYNGLSGSYIGYVSESIAATYLATLTNTQYQVGAVSLTSANVGFYNLNWEVELNSAGMASTITKIYAFISDNNVSTTIPISYPGAKANNFSTQTYTAGDSTFHSGSFTFLQPATTNIYALQLKIIYATGAIERKGVIRITRII